MATVGTLTVDFLAETAAFRSDLAKAERALNSSAAKMNRSVNRLNSGFASVTRSVRNMAVGFGAALGGTALVSLGRDIVQTAARMQTLDVRLKTLTGSAEALAETKQFLSRSAQRLSQDIFALSDSYAKLLPLVNSNLLTTQQARTILEGFANVAAATGASTNQLSQALFGMTQGLSAGTLRAEELNQVTEPLPGLMQKLDEAAGLAAGGFRRLVIDGKVTSDFFRGTLIKALESYAGAAERNAGTAAAAYTRLKNAWVELKVALAEPIIEPLANFVSGLAKLISGGGVIDVSKRIAVLREELARMEAGMTDVQRAASGRFQGMRAELTKLLEIQRQFNLLLVQSGNAPSSGGGTAITITPLKEAPIPPVPVEKIAEWREELNKADAATSKFRKNTERLVEGMREGTEETNEGARKLGFTFSSAFEDAIVKGGELRDVLQGLAQDLIRIAARRLVTEPLGNAFTSFLSTALPGFAHGGSFMVGGRSGVDQNLVAFRASAGERVTVAPPGQSAGGVVYKIDARGADISVERRIMRALQAVNASIEPRAVNATINHAQRGGRGLARA